MFCPAVVMRVRLGSDFSGRVHEFREGDAFAAVGRDVIVEDDVECVGALSLFLCGVRGVSANPLEQAS